MVEHIAILRPILVKPKYGAAKDQKKTPFEPRPQSHLERPVRRAPRLALMARRLQAVRGYSIRDCDSRHRQPKLTFSLF